ncbi:sporulation protein YtfJ [Pontibacter ummariensis]|uniref:Sporulation protein YtfJ (Spore_YtfJ) n=1 Tax=Pontibacter ummariensis TaxID=1610492 RepID=A0A239I0X7_9BACT|nr:spore germination protein GerW family protein [Pontibacter ummariensis]PRY10163.1 sporulation protein YtfJ [Pontibacter ummariensis]SNS87207.1 Sporulation protein YtfJ (Spore_YtfJ) [Pontibacter ummariensis]
MEQNNAEGGATQKTFVERIAENLGGVANAERVYGNPVERDGLTIIPVAKAQFGFGGGAGKKAGEEGSGGGGGISLTPIGYIEMKQGNSQFRPIRDQQTLLKVIAVGGLLALLTVRSLTKLLKR